MIEAGDRKIRPEMHKLINSIWNKEELPEEWKEPFIVHSVYRYVTCNADGTLDKNRNDI